MNDKILTIKKSTLVDIANEVRAKTGSTELIKVADLDDAVAELSGGGIIEVDKLPNPTAPVPGTRAVVPNTGYVDTVYLNTSLSVDEVVAELDKLTSIVDNAMGSFLVAGALIDFNNTQLPSTAIIFMERDGVYTLVDFKAMLDAQMSGGDMNSSILFASTATLDSSTILPFVGWNPNFNGEFKIDCEVLSSWNNGTTNYQFGTENDKIVNLFYTCETAPNPEFDEESVYKVSNAPVPNSGPVVPIYFNRSLSTEEVIAEMDKLTYQSNEWGPMPYPVAIIGGRAITIERYVDGDYTSYTIRESMGSAGSSTIFDSANGGWSEYYLEFAEFNNFAQDYEFTSEDNGYTIGDQNHLISNLFSIDPYPTPLWTYEDSKWQCYKKTRKITVINECSDPNMFSFYPDCEHLGNTDGGSLNNHYPKITLQPGQSVELNVVNSLAIDNSNGYEFYDVENARILELQLSKNTYGKFVIVSLSDDNAVVHIRYQS